VVSNAFTLQGRLKPVQLGFQSARDLDCIAVELLVGDQDNTGFAVDAGVAELWLGSLSDFGHIPEPDWRYFSGGDHGLTQILS
jgi:hypothetical protein